VSEESRPAVLVCDDEPQILRALKVVLREAGFEAIGAETAREALDSAAVRSPDAAIVDLVLPDGDGVEVCAQLRSWSEMPILVLSAIGEEAQKVRALEAGADDYVTKPFGPRELVARLRAALRRAPGGGEEPVIDLDGLRVDLAAHAVSRDGEEIHLTPTEFKLVATLARNRGRLMTHRGAAERGLGSLLGGGHGDPADARRQPAPQGRNSGRRPADPHRPRGRLPDRRLALT
jgi:two-component system KDP operon response regulator KdpE